MSTPRTLIAGLALAAATATQSMAAQGDPPAPSLAPFVAVNAKTVAIRDVRIIDGTGAAAKSHYTLVFSGGKIVALGPVSSTPIPLGATTIDGTGRTVMPGYVGAHNHLFTGVDNPRHIWRSMPYSFPRLYLAAGTTTLRTTGSMDIYADMHVKQRIDAGLVPGPSIDLTSPYLTGADNRDMQMVELAGADDARKTVDFWADHGVQSFKVYTNITRAELSAVIAEAHARGLKVMGHLCSVTYPEAAALGIDELEHGPFVTDTEFVGDKKPDNCPSHESEERAALDTPVDSPKVDAMIADLVRLKIPISSTLPVFESFVENSPPDAELHATLDLLAPEQRESVLKDRADIAAGKPFGLDLKGKPWPYRALLAKEMAFERKFVRAGGLLTAGPDPSGYGAVIAGTGDWRELELLVQAGFMPVEAIHIATENGAIALGQSDRVGTLAVGKDADLTLVAGDPSGNIHDIENVETVFRAGVGFDSKRLFDSVRGFVGRE